MLVPRVKAILLCLWAALFAWPLAADESTSYGADRISPTQILSVTDVERLMSLQGITLQWIEWDTRGDVKAEAGPDGVWRLEGSQEGPNGARVSVSGIITEIGEDYFLLDGRIEIVNTPDAGRRCEGDKVWRFGATQRRAYYRLREFEWCDYLTDYIDLYFAPGLR